MEDPKRINCEPIRQLVETQAKLQQPDTMSGEDYAAQLRRDPRISLNVSTLINLLERQASVILTDQDHLFDLLAARVKFLEPFDTYTFSRVEIPSTDEPLLFLLLADGYRRILKKQADEGGVPLCVLPEYLDDIFYEYVKGNPVWRKGPGAYGEVYRGNTKIAEDSFPFKSQPLGDAPPRFRVEIPVDIEWDYRDIADLLETGKTINTLIEDIRSSSTFRRIKVRGLRNLHPDFAQHDLVNNLGYCDPRVEEENTAHRVLTLDPTDRDEWLAHVINEVKDVYSLGSAHLDLIVHQERRKAPSDDERYRLTRKGPIPVPTPGEEDPVAKYGWLGGDTPFAELMPTDYRRILKGPLHEYPEGVRAGIEALFKQLDTFNIPQHVLQPLTERIKTNGFEDIPVHLLQGIRNQSYLKPDQLIFKVTEQVRVLSDMVQALLGIAFPEGAPKHPVSLHNINDWADWALLQAPKDPNLVQVKAEGSKDIARFSMGAFRNDAESIKEFQTNFADAVANATEIRLYNPSEAPDVIKTLLALLQHSPSMILDLAKDGYVESRPVEGTVGLSHLNPQNQKGKLLLDLNAYDLTEVGAEVLVADICKAFEGHCRQSVRRKGNEEK